ncbi:MAG: hypothetical protein F6J90_29430 [Moorea sp. SIOASIH]|uniref:tail fiber domain-containing protein n=1 Tax=Moorena sp. SIOASIH TaxID=2607817 RepID=UPI0013B876C7|nr:tail fiber domain-containing protein [Moorena sp. SIOASIH]NEO40245.1 hypothetical protein [Moorena sp. SIOASIH]
MTDIQRPNYFTAQFLVEEDFNDEQAYHRDMRLRHNRFLHEWGVVEGLEVTKVGDKRIAVSEGMAIDKDGREIIVLPNSPVPKTINLDGLPLNTTIEITIIYHEIKDKPYRLGNETKYTRTTERPKFIIYGGKQREHCDDDEVEVRTGSAPTDDNVIILARVTLDNNGFIDQVDNSVRKLASAKLSTLDKLEVDGTISATNLNLTGDSTIDGSLTVNGNLEVKGDVIARDTEHIAGDVSLGDQDSDEVKVTGVIRSGHSSGALRVDDGLHTTGPLTVDGNVGIGTTNPSQKLEVNGTVKATRFEGDGSGLTGISAGKWSDASSNRIYYNAGNVGIGTNNPIEKLEVTGTVKAIANHTGRDSAYGVYSQAQGSDSGSKFGLYAQATGGTSGIRYGVFGGASGGHTQYGGYFTANNTGNTTAYGIQSVVHGNGNGTKYGLLARAAGGTSGARFGVHGHASGGQTQYGGHFTATNTGNSTAFGVQSTVAGNENGTKYGLFAQAVGGTTGSRFGVRGIASGGSVQYGGHFTATNTGNTTAYGVHSQVAGNGNGTKYGLLAQATGGTTGSRFGVRGSASGGQTQYGGYFIATNTGNTTAFGVQSVVGGNENGTKYGLYGQATGGTSGSRFGVYGRANAQNNSSAIVYGVYGVASGGKTSYAGYFQGNANVTGNLTAGRVGIGITNPTEKLEVAGTVKATKFEGDGSGLTGISAGGETKWSDGDSNSIYYNAGNVGIGTTNPQSLLQVGLGGTNAPRPWMTRGLQVAWDTDHLFLGLKDEGADRKDSVLAWGDNTNDAFRFIFAASRGAADGQEIMRLQPNGNVGIGITNPTEKLEVTGTVKATRFEGDGSGLTGISGDGQWQTLSGNRIRYNGGVLVGNYLLSRTNDSQERGVSGASFAITETVNKIPRCYGVRGHFQGFLTSIVVKDEKHPDDEIIVKDEANDTRDDSFEAQISILGGITPENSPESVKSGDFLEQRTEISVEAVDTIKGGTVQPIDTIEGDKSPQPIPKPGFFKSGYGGYFTAINNGTSTVYGVYGEVTGRQGSTSYGVYGSAKGAGNNYAGYFNGRVHVTGNIIANNLQQKSSRQFKENINTLAIEDAIETLEGLNPVQFRYKEDHQKETHIGFIAEDVPDLVASRDRKTLSPMDIVAVLTKVVKEQNNTISLLMEKVQTLEQKSQSSAF